MKISSHMRTFLIVVGSATALLVVGALFGHDPAARSGAVKKTHYRTDGEGITLWTHSRCTSVDARGPLKCIIGADDSGRIVEVEAERDGCLLVDAGIRKDGGRCFGWGERSRFTEAW